MNAVHRIAVLVVIWMAAFALSAMLDRPVAILMRESGVEAYLREHVLLSDMIKAPGEFYFAVAVAVVVGFAYPTRWRASAFVIVIAGISGINGLIKWVAGRTRPFRLPPVESAQPFTFEPFRGGLAGLAVGKNLCFPSGHAAATFATAAAVAMLWPRSRWRWVGFAVATTVSVERVAENSHWLSDTVAGAAIGIAGAHLIRLIVKRLKLDSDYPLA